MPYPRAHTLLTFFGDAWAAVEEWSTSLRVDSATLPTVAVLDSVAARWATFHANASAGISPNARFLGVKAAPIGADGRYAPNGLSVTSLRPSPVIGGATFAGAPQLSMVVTLNTDLIRGKGSVGRMYLPACGIPAGSDGRITVANAQALAGAAATLLTDLNGLLEGDLAVFGAGLSGTGPGSVRDVIGVRVGRVIDTQRRRRNQLDEGYVTSPVTGSTPN
jgi:hypothetical protein